MRIDHAQLRALAAVIREGSFERAALSLNVTSSAVSQRIKALEDRVGKLLIRRTIPTEATPEGQVLVQLAEQTALLERDAFERIGISDSELSRASIAVAVNHDSMETWFPEAVQTFSQSTSTTLDLHTEDQDHTVALLRQGAVLGAVTTLSEPVQGCQIHALGSIRYAATCTPEFHARHFAKGVTAQALAQAPVLVFNRKDDMQARYARRLAGVEQPHTAPQDQVCPAATAPGAPPPGKRTPGLRQGARLGRRAAVLAALERRGQDHGPADPRHPAGLGRTGTQATLSPGRLLQRKFP